MKKSLDFLAVLMIIFSCSKPEENSVPDGMVKVIFSASSENIKTTLNGLSLEWSGDETVNVWYKDKTGDVKRTTASFESFSGTGATLSIIIPETSNQDDFYAEINGVNDSSLDFYPWGSKGPRTITVSTQQAVPNGFDPYVLAYGARWTRSLDCAKPFLKFNNLHNILAVSLDNQTGKTIDKITLSSSSNLVCKNYWSVLDDGSTKYSFSGVSGNAIELVGKINDGKAIYCFVVPVKNNNGNMFKLDDIHLSFHCETGENFEVENASALELDKNSYCEIGEFMLTPALLNYPQGAPFGTCWGTQFMKDWNKAGFSSGITFSGLASFDTRPEVTAIAKASATKAIQYSKSGNERMEGKFSFEFVTSDSGKGRLSFHSSAGAAGHTASILKNGKEIHRITYSSTNQILTEYEVEVIKGDVIRILYNNVSSNAKLFCGAGDYYSSTGIIDNRIKWWDAAQSIGNFASPGDLVGDDQSSFFKEM